MAPRPRSRKTASPPRPAKYWPVLLLIFAVIAGVGATVLLANGQRNLRLLAQFLNLPIPAPAMGQASRETAAQVPKVQKSIHRWPWLGFTLTPTVLEAVLTPADMCSRLAAGTLEIPAYSETEQRGWKCSMTQEGLGANRAASLLLQAQGPLHEPADDVRVTFNLANGDLDGDLAAQALVFLNLAVSMPPDVGLSDRLAKMLTNTSDFYFVAGYQSLTFRQEVGKAEQRILNGINNAALPLGYSESRWPVERQSAGVARNTKTGRLPESSNPPAGSD